jgi:transposase-like protein
MDVIDLKSMATTQETTSTALVKSDRAGRTRYTKTYKSEVVSAYEQSGMSAAAFAEHCGIKYPTLASWLAKAKHSSESNDHSHELAQPFVIAEFASPHGTDSIKLELPSGIIVHVSSSSQLGLLADLLKTLR